MIRAQKRGVKISAVLDKSNRGRKYSAATFLKNMGIPVFIDDKHAIAHNKIMIIDNRVVITGSFNFTKAAENKNAENLLILDDLPDLTRAYQENFQKPLEACRPLPRPGGVTGPSLARTPTPERPPRGHRLGMA